jgi:hypothetical protein
MTFSEALHHLREWSEARRDCWPDDVRCDWDGQTLRLMIHGDAIDWVPCLSDMMATDWRLL